jgi:PKD repeat protein
VSDFTQFTGQLEGPDAAGYDQALTRTRTARDFIQTIANFALSFLGLVATLMVIYGGVLYVTSRGDEEAATNGKKTISYAAIGIVIILGSFAFVNTLLGATGGTQGQVAGTVNSGTTITQAGGSFDVQSVLQEIGSITSDYQTSYTNYLFIAQQIAYMQSLQMPRAVTVTEREMTLEGLGEAISEGMSGQDQTPFVDTYTLVDQREVQQYIANLRRALQDIQGKADPLSDTYEAAQAMLNYLRTGQASTISFKDSLIPSAYAADDCDPFVDEVCAQTFRDFSIFFPGGTIYNTEASLIDDQVLAALEEMQVRAFADYQEEVTLLAVSFQDLEALFDTSGDGSGSSLSEVLNAFEEAKQALENVKDPSLFGANSSRELLNKMNALAGLVQNLEFVNVRMTASTLKGNAPVIVRFNALGSEDPSGLTVTNDQIEWDLNGDGLFNTALDGSPSGATVSFTYDVPGTYRARVRVRSQSENIAAGIASLSIQVDAPRSIIILDAIAGGETSRLADYGAFPPISKSAYKVTMAEAQEGVTFDASQTTDGNGNANGIVSASWDFGDNETLAGSWGEQGIRTPIHRYGVPGSYDVVLTVTDETGVEDRKVFTLFVASPAARLTASPAKGVVGTVFSFDATGSSTDIGTIVDYKWSATVNGEPYALTAATGNRIKAAFDRPGIYVITLTVTDSSGKEDETSGTIVVESQAPVATFDFSVPKSNQPGIVVFDASESYDPDAADALTFDWLIEGVRGKDYQILETSDKGDEITVKFGEAKEYKVSLTVSDQHPEGLKRETTISKDLQVTSVLDAELTVQGNPARHLDEDGKASVEFLASSDNATAFQIDYGDGTKEFTDLISNKQSIFTHEYESAGVFFATLTALDDDNNKTIVDQRVYIAVGDSPIAVMEVLSEGEDIGLGPVLKGNIRTRFTFDADRSINVDGTNTNLSYSWNFGDGVTSNQKTVTHVFDEHATYTVTLTVKDKKDPALTSSTTMQIEIRGIAPKIRSISVVPDSTTVQTPLKVNVSVDAVDEDGRITFVKGLVL